MESDKKGGSPSMPQAVPVSSGAPGIIETMLQELSHMSTIRAAIVGYGNLGKSVEKIIGMQPDMELVGIFSRRTKLATEAPVFPVDEIGDYADRVDVLYL